MKKILFLLFIIIISQFEILSQKYDYKFERISLEQGLSQSTVYDIVKDSKGFMWFGTQEGLNKYDGKNFTIYKNEPENQYSLINNFVLRILIDKYDKLWILTQIGGLEYFDPEKEIFYHFQNDTNDINSLSNIRIRSFTEDSTGVVWIGTSTGLNRFNRENKNFDRFLYDSTDNSSISNSSINNVFHDSHKRLWVCTMNGINLFKNNKLKRYYLNAKNKLSNQVIGLYEDKNKNLWARTNNGLFKYNQKNDKFEQIITKKDIEFSILSISQGQNDDIWFGTNMGLFKYDNITKILQQYKANSSINSLSNDTVRFILKDTKERIWIATRNGLNLYDEKTDNFKQFYYPSEKNISDSELNTINFIIENHNGDIGVASRRRFSQGSFVGYVDINSNEIVRLKHDPSNTQSISSDYISRFYLENTGIMWLGTFARGVNKLNPINKKFEHYYNKPNDINSLPNNFIWTILEDYDGNIWTGTFDSGISKYDKKTKKYKVYKTNSNKSNSLQHNSVNEIIQFKKDEIWIGTIGAGISSLNYKTEKFKHYKNIPNDSTSLTQNFIRKIFYDKKGFLWVLTNNQGIAILNPETEKFERIINNPNDSNSLSSNFVFSLLFDSEGYAWFGTTVALDKYNLKTKTFKHYPMNVLDGTGPSGKSVLTMIEGDNNVLWFGSAEGGLIKFDKKTEKFRYWTTKDGLANNMVYEIQKDDQGNLWMSTNNGISKFYIKTETFENYDSKDGLQSNEFNMNASFKNKDGKMYFAGINGYNAFYPNQIKKDTSKAPVAITKFTVFSKEVKLLPYNKRDIIDSTKLNEIIKHDDKFYLNKPIQYTKHIILSYKEKVFSFEFAALHYMFPEKNTYKYKMKGFDEEWIYSGNRKFVTYTNLPAGEYVFAVKAANPDGIWSDEATEIIITITPPFWSTWWFRSLVGFWLVLATITYIKLRERSLRIQKDRLEKQVKERTKQVVMQRDEILEKNEELNQQKEEILAQRDEIESQKDEIVAQRDFVIEQRDKISYQNLQIKDSINYAHQIQITTLPPEIMLKQLLNEYFVFYRPRDIVSGDFYWVKQVDDLILIAVADCTGHGVPAAFMSMLGTTLLNEIVTKTEISEPNQALEEMRNHIKFYLRQTGKSGEMKDGMDVAFCAYNKKTKLLQYSGANNPLILIKNNELIEIKPTRSPIGVYIKERKFETHKIQLSKGDLIYMFTDGITDQFGGKKGYKFMSKNLKLLLLSIYREPVIKQKYLIKKKLEEWQGENKQVDDILLMGIKI